jgi:metallo-beta-lactamase family protein
MNIKFCGAAEEVTGSSHLITLEDGYKILLDCGLFQGKGRDVWDKNNKWHFDPADIDVMILSHAHIDHSGRIPQLVKDGFKGNIYCTHATRSLSAIMLLDSAKIQERDVSWYNRKLEKKRKRNGKKFRVPLYQSEDIPITMDAFMSCPYNRWIHINDRVEVLFRDAGHILGSASVTLKIKDAKKEVLVGFTGDIGRPDRPILRDPDPMPEVDYLICESTYGDRDHESKPEQSTQLKDIIERTCITNKGKLIIPAFSVGRTQEIIYMMDKMATAGVLPKVRVYVDSPLAVNATMVFGAHPECYDDNLFEYLLIDDDPFGFNSLTYVRTVETSKDLNTSTEPCVIISSAGMMNAGRVKHHLFHNIEDPNSGFLIVGYCSPETPGGILRNGAESIKVFGEWKLVKAKVDVMDSFSAHGDRNEMYAFIKNQKRLKTLFLVHGDKDAQAGFKQFLTERSFGNIEVPRNGQEYHITL